MFHPWTSRTQCRATKEWHYGMGFTVTTNENEREGTKERGGKRKGKCNAALHVMLMISKRALIYRCSRADYKGGSAPSETTTHKETAAQTAYQVRWR
ncbi:hypothetical protein EYF80_042612 [Liparis tanakae]|uniref:Uncharacterized protein n=1 Tax=Liparis tanakae TaxID=230148 RepID=A0A4Z2G101_9TELE|nr:hypothetical protein EYF80_042612 [Liparis tanakae]